MRHRYRAFTLIIIALMGLFLIGFIALQQTPLTQSRYFSQTDQVVREPFLSTFNEHGGLETFGYPLTDAANDPNGILTQTFQRAQMQLTLRGVELAPLGSYLRLGDSAGNYEIAEEFQDFYSLHGGETFFGSALTTAHDEYGLLVQDFERGRLVSEVDGTIHLANLGAAYLAAFPLPEAGQAAPNPELLDGAVLDARLNISVENSTVGQSEEQTIYLYVEDQRRDPVFGARALAILQYDGSTLEIPLPNTDERGFASVTFTVPAATPGSRVLITIHVLVGTEFFSLDTTYFQWW